MQERRIERTEPVFGRLRPSPPLPGVSTPERHTAFSSSVSAHEGFPLHHEKATIESTQRSARKPRRGKVAGSIPCPAVITGAHAIMFTKDAAGVRAFLRDVLGLSSVDAGGGWPIFGLPPSELAVHPSDGEPRDELYLIVDDLNATVAELEAKGVTFTRPITDAGWGLLTAVELPDGRELALYEPRHPRPLGPSA
jgi:hypothetical protein